MFFTSKPFVAFALSFGGHTRTHNPQDIIVAFCVSNNDDTSPDRPNGNESILLVRMFLVVDFQVVNTGLEKLSGFVKRQAVLCPVDSVLRWIPLESHGMKRIYANDLVSQWLITV
jgi:hypothetical protein